MLEYLIDDLVIWAYRNELLKDYEKRYVYEYAIQVILYNMMLLVVTFLISVFTNNIQSFIMFMIFFVMLRRNLGGFHFKNKYICMTVSISMYVIITFFGGEIFLLYENYIFIIWGVLAILCLFMPALNDKNYNKKVVNILICIHIVLMFTGIYLKMQCVSWAVLFNIAVLSMFIFQKFMEVLNWNAEEEK